MKEAIFCCPCESFTYLNAIRSPAENQLFQFFWFVTKHASISQYAFPSNYTIQKQRDWIRQSSFCVQLEKWVDGYQIRQRYFMRHPCYDRYVEADGGLIIGEGFLRNWEQIKVRCGCVESGTFYVLKQLTLCQNPKEATRKSSISCTSTASMQDVSAQPKTKVSEGSNSSFSMPVEVKRHKK